MDTPNLTQISGLSRRSMLLAATTIVVAAAAGSDEASAQASTNPLASWSDGPAKQAILDFVRDTTDASSKNFVPAGERIATFDQDGTLWVEQPLYSQLVYCLERVPDVVRSWRQSRSSHFGSSKKSRW
jgi:hypothetical protein